MGLARTRRTLRIRAIDNIHAAIDLAVPAMVGHAYTMTPAGGAWVSTLAPAWAAAVKRLSVGMAADFMVSGPTLRWGVGCPRATAARYEFVLAVEWWPILPRFRPRLDALAQPRGHPTVAPGTWCRAVAAAGSGAGAFLLRRSCDGPPKVPCGTCWRVPKRALSVAQPAHPAPPRTHVEFAATMTDLATLTGAAMTVPIP